MTSPVVESVEQVSRVDGLLAVFNRAHVLGAADVHVARRLQTLCGETDARVLLAAALAVRAVRQGSVVLELPQAAEIAVDGVTAEDVRGLPWPEPSGWVAAVERSPLVAVGMEGPADRPLRWVNGLLYLDRYWRQERVVAEYVDTAMLEPPSRPDPARLDAALERLFGRQDGLGPGPGATETSADGGPGSQPGVNKVPSGDTLFTHADASGLKPNRQRLAAYIAAHRRFSIVAGGPGTGKTTTVARLLAVLQDLADGGLRVALAAPTGKAAARLTEAAVKAVSGFGEADKERVGTLTASTLHRLLGSRRGERTRFWYNRDNRLPYDVVVVDEASMVSLTLMSRLVGALRSQCRLILVGDPNQLASIEVGAVLEDLVKRPAPSDVVPLSVESDQAQQDLSVLSENERQAALMRGVVRLTEPHRFFGNIADLAEAIRLEDADAVMRLLRAEHPDIEYVDGDPGRSTADVGGLRQDVLDSGRALITAARNGLGDEALEALGRHRVLCAHREGPYGVDEWGKQVQNWLADAVDGYGSDGLWYVGRPLLVTSNDYQLKLYNGDTGVIVNSAGHPRAAFVRDGVLDLLTPSRLGDVQSVHAMSIHRSQGSQFERVSIVLPTADSRLLTNELLYTAVTRAEKHVRILGTESAIRAAVCRPITRASGLRGDP